MYFLLFLKRMCINKTIIYISWLDMSPLSSKFFEVFFVIQGYLIIKIITRVIVLCSHLIDWNLVLFLKIRQIINIEIWLYVHISNLLSMESILPLPPIFIQFFFLYFYHVSFQVPNSLLSCWLKTNLHNNHFYTTIY